MTRLYLVFFLLLSPPWLSAQDVFKHLGNEDGLSNNTVLTILQDRKGFMWFGTDDGLNKYDGHGFKVFKPAFRNKKGISHNIAKILFEDHAGNIWIGTDGGGLNKFDPVTEAFTTFYAEEGNLTGLSHNNITALAEEQDRYLWIGTYGGGLNRLDLKNNTFEHFVNDEGNEGTIASFFINSLTFDDDGNLWIGTWGRGLDKLNVNTMTFTHFQNHPNEAMSISDNTVNHVFIDRKKRMWVATWDGGLNLFHPQQETFSRFNLKENNLPTNNVRHISEDNRGNLWLASFGDGLIRFSTETYVSSNFRHHSLGDEKNRHSPDREMVCSNNLWTVYFSPDNILWAGSIEGGISKLDFNQKKFFNLDNLTDQSQQADIIDEIVETRSGNILIGTFDKGLIVLDTNYQHVKNSPLYIPLLSNKINTIWEDSHSVLWIGTEAGITTFDPKNQRVKNYVINSSSTGLSFNNTKVIYEDHEGTIWVGTWGGGLNKFNRDADTFQYYFASPRRKVTFTVDLGALPVSPRGVFLAGSFNHWNTRTIPMKQVGEHLFQVTLELHSQKIEYRFLNGDVWENVPASCAFQKNRLALVKDTDMDAGVVMFGSGCNKDFQEAKVSNVPDGLASNHIWSILEDHEGFLWIGTNEGLSRFDKKTNTFSTYKHADDTASLSDNHVSCIYEDEAYNLWIGTLGGGVNRFNRISNNFTNFSEEAGLGNNIVKGMLEDGHHHLWISTNNGLSRFNYKTNEFKNYNQSDGIENSYRVGASLKRTNGEMLFGGAHGITRFNPDSVSTNLMWPKVYITDLFLFGQALTPGRKVNGEMLLDTALMYARHIQLSYDQNMLAFQFASPEFTDSGEPLFRYTLAGFDRQWYESKSADHLASYTNLPPGDYTFRVKVSNQEGVFGDSMASLHVSISPPFWDTSLFKMLLFLIFVVCLYLAYRIVAAKKEEKLRQATLVANQKIKDLENENLQNEIDYKNRELANISMNLIEKTKFLNEQIKRLETIANISEHDVKSKLNNLIDNFSKEITTEKDWAYFELHFDKVHQNFISNLKAGFPELSATDIRLAAFIRMDLSNKEIAELMNKSVRSIESSRYRLRKNLNLRQGDNLTDFLFRL